eukprot:jgi/Tetstr1/453566/TSEL_040534.t1
MAASAAGFRRLVGYASGGALSACVAGAMAPPMAPLTADPQAAGEHYRDLAPRRSAMPELTSPWPGPVGLLQPLATWPSPRPAASACLSESASTSSSSSSSKAPSAEGAAGPPPGSSPVLESGSAESDRKGDNRCCLGFLYFNQSMHDRQQGPMCVGVRTRPSTVQEDMRNPLPGLVDFKYMCIGYSVYTVNDRKVISKTRRPGADSVDLPYCEGLEIISSREMQGSPVLLKEGMGGEPVGRDDLDSSGAPEKEGRFPPGKNFVPGRDVNMENFVARFTKMAKKIAQKMVDNLKLVASTIQKLVTGDGGKPKSN